MRPITELFTLDGQGIPVPDADVTVITSDVECDAVRDRSGVLHRAVLRPNVRAWEFSYDQLTDEERQQLLQLLSGKPLFPFTYPGGSATCYCSGTSAQYHDAAQGLWKNFRFRVEEV